MSPSEQAGKKRKLKIDMSDLESAFENGSIEIDFYLDLETGKVEMVSYEFRRELQEIYEELDQDDNQFDAVVARAISERDMPDWEKQALLEIHVLEKGLGARFISIPHRDSREGYMDMVNFIRTVGSESLREQLEFVIRGRAAFRRFEGVLWSYPSEQGRWFKYKEDRLHERIMEWLESEGIELVLENRQ